MNATYELNQVQHTQHTKHQASSAKGPGGRPKNLWTSSRKRRAARLRLFTTLTVEDIRQIIKGHAFEPCKRDVEKNLRLMLPGYVRPHKLEHGKLVSQWSQIRRCRSGRITKRRGSRPAALQILDRQSPQVGPLRDIPPNKPISTYTALEDSPSLSVAPTINTLKERLGHKYSAAQIRHVHSVFRYSLSDSWRSSVLSFKSSLLSSNESTRESNLRSTNDTKPRRQSMVGKFWRKLPELIEAVERQTTPFKLTRDEQDIWEELIDDSKFDNTDDTPEPKNNSDLASLEWRPCCELRAPVGNPRCRACGFTSSHYYGLVGLPDLWFEQADHRAAQCYELDLSIADWFGNTPLHFAAASKYNYNSPGEAHFALKAILILLQRSDAKINARNTMGQTFMHLLGNKISMASTYSLDQSSYVEILKYLINNHFDFSVRDHFGRSLGNIISLNFPALLEAFGSMETVLYILGQDVLLSLNDMDSRTSALTYTDEYLLMAKPPNDSVQSFKDKLFAYIGRNHRDISGLPAVLTGFNPIKFQYNDVCRKLNDRRKDRPKSLFPLWVDINGDTAIIGYVKAIPRHEEDSLYQEIISLLSSGADIHMRDRRGNTALAIAAGRGLERVTEMLLKKGANPNSCNAMDPVSQHSWSILRQTTNRMICAQKEDNTEKVARYLRCLSLLTEYGATAEPSVIEQWGTREAQVAEKDEARHAQNKRAEVTQDADRHQVRQTQSEQDDEAQYIASDMLDVPDIQGEKFEREDSYLLSHGSNAVTQWVASETQPAAQGGTPMPHRGSVNASLMLQDVGGIISFF